MEQVVSLFLEVLNFVVDRDGNVCHVQTEWPCYCGSPACVVSVTVSSVQHRADPDSADFTGRDLLLRPAPIWPVYLSWHKATLPGVPATAGHLAGLKQRVFPRATLC